MNERDREARLPRSKPQACAILAAEFSLERHEAQEQLGADMLEALLNDGLAIVDRRHHRIGVSRNGSVAAQEFRAINEAQRYTGQGEEYDDDYE